MELQYLYIVMFTLHYFFDRAFNQQHNLMQK